MKWQLSFLRNRNFCDWVREQYSADELRQLVDEATGVPLARMDNPLSNEIPIDEKVMRRTTSRLMTKYGEDIWRICLGAGGQGDEDGPAGIKCLARLDRAFEVRDTATFEEFLIRNALKQPAAILLEIA
jgi:hypothetical protein